MSATVCVYYRIDPGHAQAARSALEQILAQMRAGLCRRACLLTKADEPALWMEVYEEVPDRPGFERALEAAVRRHGLDACLAAGERRHLEVFTPQCA